MVLGIAVLGFGSFIIWEKPGIYNKLFPGQKEVDVNDSDSVKLHLEFNPASPITLADSIEIKAIVLDEQNKIIDVPVSWKIKEDEDRIYINISQRENTVKVTRKPEVNLILSQDSLLIIELIAKVRPLSNKQTLLVDGVYILIGN